MLNTKYSKVLSVILAIAIIAIIGLLIFMGINFYKTVSTESETKDFFEQFNSYIEGNNSENKEEKNNINNETSNEPTNKENETLINSEIINEEISNENKENNDKDLTINGIQGVGIIEIPKTKAKYAILNDSSSKALDKGIAILYGPGVNKIGNTVLAGHNYRNGTFFSNNKKLTVGDKIYITDMSGKKITYEIYKKYQTDANDFSYATRDTEGRREISLTTCTDDSGARIIIWAKEI